MGFGDDRSWSKCGWPHYVEEYTERGVVSTTARVQFVEAYSCETSSRDETREICVHSLGGLPSTDAIKGLSKGPGVACRLEGLDGLCYLSIPTVMCQRATCDEVRFIERPKLMNREVGANRKRST